MAILGATFQIGRSALAAYQAAVAVTGQNIANVGNADYTRLTGRLSALSGGSVSGLRPGAGVQLSGLHRHVSESLEARLRDARGSRSGAEAQWLALQQSEALHHELTDQDISTLMTEFFATFSALETSPTDAGARQLVIAGAEALTHSLQQLRSGIVQQAVDANTEIEALVVRADALASEIADLNVRVVQEESGGATLSSPLRDRRDSLLRELGELVQVTVREQSNGGISVYVGSEPLVQFDRSRGLTVERAVENGLEVSVVRFADNLASVRLGGRLGGLADVRDGMIRQQIDGLDELARGLIYDVNRAHSAGVGLIGYDALQGAFAVQDASAALNSEAAGLRYPLSNGSLIVNVRDTASGQITTRLVEVDLDGIGGETSLDDLAADFDAVPGLTASVLPDGRLELSADPGNEVWFTEDSSGALAALGVGAFFIGEDAETIAIADAIRANPNLIAASLSGDALDGDNAGRIAQLQAPDAASAILSGRSLLDFHATLVSDLAIAAGGAQLEYEASDAVFAGLTAQREALSGVSLDEEAINLTRFETAYQGAARYLGVLDEMTSQILALV